MPRGRHRGGRHGGRHHRHRNWYGPVTYPYYGYPYYNDYLWRYPTTTEPVVMIDREPADSGSTINWPTIALSLALTSLLLLRR